MSVKVENITKLYGQQKALDNISFEVSAGQVVGFLGPNGAGKSTMMKILSCFIPQTSGRAAVCGYDVTDNPVEVKKNIGYLPENNPLYTDMYIKEYLSFIAGVHGIKKAGERIKEVVAMTGLEPEQKKKIGMLSKGYRQRVGLAQSLIHDPQVLILDEPTSGLDPNQLAEIRALITEIGKEKIIILSTHIMQEVEAVCSRVIIINKGKIVADDDTGMLQRRAGKETWIEVEFDSPASKEQLEHIKGVVTALLVSGNTWKLKARSDMDARAEIFRFAVQKNISVLTLRKEEQSLEEIFQKLTK